MGSTSCRTVYPNLPCSTARSSTTFIIAPSHTSMSVWNRPFAGVSLGDAAVLDTFMPPLIYRARASTGNRRRARPERFCSYLPPEQHFAYSLLLCAVEFYVAIRKVTIGIFFSEERVCECGDGHLL